VRAPVQRQQFALAQLRARWARHRPDTRAQRQDIASSMRRMAISLSNQLGQKREALAALSAQLEMLNPQRTLERGYAIVSDARGHVLRSPDEILLKEPLTVRLVEGSAQVGVASVQRALE
ncbi:MAG: exodeoxyribonuclease VII large subunit, partial [Gammaproteobacteria bacterium]